MRSLRHFYRVFCLVWLFTGFSRLRQTSLSPIACRSGRRPHVSFFYKYFLFVSFGGTRFFSLELVGCSPRLFSQPFNCLPFLFFAFLGSHPHPLWSIVVNEPLAHHHHHHYHHGRRYYERNHFFFDFFSFCRNRTVDETDLPISAATDATEQKNKRNIQENPRENSVNPVKISAELIAT